MGLKDNGTDGVPKLLAVFRRVVDAGIGFNEHRALSQMVNSRGAARIAARGPCGLMTEALTERIQGDAQSVTTLRSSTVFDAALPIIRERIHELLPADYRARVPPVARMTAAYSAARGLRGLNCRQLCHGLPKVLRMLNPRVKTLTNGLGRRIDGERQVPEGAKWITLSKAGERDVS